MTADRESPCIVCGSRSSSPLLSTAGDPGDLKRRPLTLRRCGDCGTVFQAGWSESFPEELYDYYSRERDAPPESLFNPITERRYEELCRRFARLTSGRRLLDVGCGRGQFVAAAGRLGWEAQGIELSAPAVAICERFSLPVRRLEVFSPELSPGAFDVVTLFEVIEHVARPASFLRRSAELLKPGGLLYLTTPNFSSLESRLAGAGWEHIHREHLTYLTPATLRGLVEDCGILGSLEFSSRNISVAALLSRSRPLTPAPSGLPDGPSLRERDQAWRRRLEASVLLRALKRAANLALDATGLGSTLTALCVRR